MAAPEANLMKKGDFFSMYKEFKVRLDRVCCYYKHPIVKTERNYRKCKQITGQ